MSDNSRFLLLFFSISTVILYFGPETFFPSDIKDKIPIIKTQLGSIKGSKIISIEGKTIFSYTGKIFEGSELNKYVEFLEFSNIFSNLVIHASNKKYTVS